MAGIIEIATDGSFDIDAVRVAQAVRMTVLKYL